jgi:hypothetical protein
MATPDPPGGYCTRCGRPLRRLGDNAVEACTCDPPAPAVPLDDALRDPAGFVAGMAEERGTLVRHPFRTTDFAGVRGSCLDCGHPVTSPVHRLTPEEAAAAREERYRAALDELRAKGPHAKTRWRHRKGGLVEVVFNGLLESTKEPHVAYRELPDGPNVWFRPLSEFLDGRFTPEPADSPEST